MKRWLVNVLIGFDQLGNAIADGNPDETISSRVGKAAAAGKRRAIAIEGLIDACFAVFFGQRHHCAASIEHDEASWLMSADRKV